MAAAELSIVIRAKNEAGEALNNLDSQLKSLGVSMQDIASAGSNMLETVNTIGHAISEINLTVGVNLDVLDPAQKLKGDLQKLFESEIMQKILLSDEVFEPAEKLKEELQKLFGQDIVQGVSIAAGGLGSGEGMDTVPQFGGSGDLPSYASGISRVPYDQVARIHKDEAVLPVNEADKYRNGGGDVTIGDIHIYAQPGEDLSRSAIMRIRNELARIDRRIQ